MLLFFCCCCCCFVAVLKNAPAIHISIMHLLLTLADRTRSQVNSVNLEINTQTSIYTFNQFDFFCRLVIHFFSELHFRDCLERWLRWTEHRSCNICKVVQIFFSSKRNFFYDPYELIESEIGIIAIRISTLKGAYKTKNRVSVHIWRLFKLCNNRTLGFWAWFIYFINLIILFLI